MKKTQTLLTILTLSLLAAGCAEYSKEPVSDLEQLRATAKRDLEAGPQKPRVITKEVIVEKPVVVVREESTIDDKFIVITADNQMAFNEGQRAQFKLRARVFVPGIQIQLKATGLPQGANLEKSTTEPDVYLLTWTPSLYLVPTNAAMKTFSAQVFAEVISANSPAELAKLKGLTRQKDLSLILFKNAEAPSGLTVTGLPTELNEDSLTTFSVVVKVPGTDANAPQKPRLVVSYDGVRATAGNNFWEMDGSRYIVADANNKDAEFIGDSKWKFTLIFDTKNISVQPQLSKDGALMPNADGTRVRLNFRVFSPYGIATPEALSQVKIRYTKAIAAPRFDLSGLGQQGLQVAPGQNITLNFLVTSADSKAAVKVEPVTSTLPGTPKVECRDAATGPAKQECTLTWSIPCGATNAALTGEIPMAAQSVSNGRNSEVTSYKLKVLPATDDKKLCPTEAAK